jgi:hypothetical protein
VLAAPVTEHLYSGQAMTLMLIPSVIRIEIPALDRLITLLSDQRDTQRRLDALADQLNQSSAMLETVINKEK